MPIDPEIEAFRARLLSSYRERGYAFLAEAISSSGRGTAELERVDRRSKDGQEWQIEVTAHWDDRPNRDIRVWAKILKIPLKPLLGFIPIYFGGDSDSFIVRPDGSFVDE